MSNNPFQAGDIPHSSQQTSDAVTAANLPQSELRECFPLVERPRPYQPSPPPPGRNPYLTLRYILHELFWQAACGRQGQDVLKHINPTTNPWDEAESQARSCSAGWGIPFVTFDPILTDAKRTMRELVQVAAGNTSVPFDSLDFRYALLEERLQALANSVPAGDATPAEVAPVRADDFIERLLAGPADEELTPRGMVLLEAHLKQPISLPTIQRERQTMRGRSPTDERRNKLKLIRDFNRLLQQRKTVDDLVSKLYVDRPRDLDAELADAFVAVATGVRESTRLMASIPYLWKDEGEYRRLAACVTDAATTARTAYMAVDIRLRRAARPGEANPMLETLNDVLTVQGRAPLDPTGIPGRVNAILTTLYTNRAELFPRVDGKGCLDRMLDQLARVPPATNTAPAVADPSSTVSPSTVAKQSEGEKQPAEPDWRNSEESGAVGELPTGKVPGVVSLNVLRATLEMTGFPEWRKRFESWPEVPFLRLRCVELFPGQPFSPATIELLIAWFQESGLTPDQARHLPLSEALRRLSPQLTTGARGGATIQTAAPPMQPNLSRLDQAKQFLAGKEQEEEARQMAMRMMPYILVPPNEPYTSLIGSTDTKSANTDATPTEVTQGEGEKSLADAEPDDSQAEESSLRKKRPSSDAQKQICEAIRKKGHALDRQELAAASGYTPGTIGQYTPWMIQEGLLVKTRDGYALPPPPT